MTIQEEMCRFTQSYSKSLAVKGTIWKYHCLGSGSVVLWLTGGLRRASPGFAFLERLAVHHTVIAPDYPPVQTIASFLSAFDAILLAVKVDRCVIIGQSYGGLLAQAYLAHRPAVVDRLILSSSGPADFGKTWLPVEYALILLARLLPERTVKDLLLGGLLKAFSFPEDRREEWTAAIQAMMREDLTRADVVSHFAVAADIIKTGLIAPGAYQNWPGKVFVLRSNNDPTQSEKDFPHYERLFRRPVTFVDMGNMGHTAALFDPDRYLALLSGCIGR